MTDCMSCGDSYASALHFCAGQESEAAHDARSVDSGRVASDPGFDSHLLSSGPNAEALPLGERVERPDMQRIEQRIADCAHQYGCRYWNCTDMVELVAYALQLEQDAAGLRAALALYADPSSYRARVEQTSGRVHVTSWALADCGLAAREALGAALAGEEPAPRG